MTCSEAAKSKELVQGKVSKWFSDREFGFAEVSGQTVFVHASSIRYCHVGLCKNDQIVMKVVNDPGEGIEKFKAFHYSAFINFDFMKKERFEFFSEMSKHIPVYRVTVPWNIERLDEVYDAIIQNVKP